MSSVLLIFRKSVPHFFSIEKIFNALAERFSDQWQVKKISVPNHTSSVSNILSNLRFTRAQKADVYHVTGDVHYLVLALPKKKTILTIHDCVFLYQYSGLKKWFFLHLFLKWPVKRCTIITTISEQSKKDIVQFSGCKPSRVRVINNPVPEAIYYKERPFNVEEPVVLFLGSTPNKNLDRCIEALAGIRCSLVIVGIIPDDSVRKLQEHGIKYSNTHKLSEQALADQYYNSDVLLFPTLFEGFGLPIVEAQRAGRPVVTSNLSPMKEVAAGGACLVDPYDVASIRKGLLKVMEEKEYRQNLVVQGFENVKRFEPGYIAMQYENLYKEIIG